MLKKIFTICTVLALTTALDGCMVHKSLGAEQRPATWGKLIDKDSNFYQVSSNLYRSEQPLAAQQKLLLEHDIKTVISLRRRYQTKDELDPKQFQLLNIPLYTWAIDRQDVLRVMQEIKRAQQQGHKVLIHCYHGSDRTGSMVAMYRIIFEGWPIDEAVKEMKTGGYGFHPIWINIDGLFTVENIAWIKQQLQQSTQ